MFYDEMAYMKLMIKIFITLMLLIQYANASEVNGYSHKCGDLLNGVDSNNVAAIGQTKSYIMGYITGINDGNFTSYGDTRFSLRGEDNSADDLFYALVKFCRDNPLQDSWDGARDIYKKLE